MSNSSKISFGPQALKSIYTSWEMTYRKCATPSQFWITGRNRILHYNVADFNSFWSFLIKGTSPTFLPTWRPLQASHEKQSKESDGKWLSSTASIFCWKPTLAEKQKQAAWKNLICLRKITKKSKSRCKYRKMKDIWRRSVSLKPCNELLLRFKKVFWRFSALPSRGCPK